MCHCGPWDHPRCLPCQGDGFEAPRVLSGLLIDTAAIFGEPVRAMIEKMIKTGRVDVGVAYLRKSGHAVIALAVSPRALRIERTSMIPTSGGDVVIRGEILDPVGEARAMINRGRYGFNPCTPDPSVALPRFAFTCSALPADEAAWLSMSVIAPGRMVGSEALAMLVWPAGALKKTYAKLKYDEAAAPPSGGLKVADLVQEINRVRKEAGLAPLRFAEQESRTVTRLAPHYFAALCSRRRRSSAASAWGIIGAKGTPGAAFSSSKPPPA